MTDSHTSALSLSALPALGTDLEGGTFAGVITKSNGTHSAVILMQAQAQGLTWKKAMNWAKKQGGELPSRPVAAMLFANVKSQLAPRWHWTCEEDDASFAWLCGFSDGFQDYGRKSYEGSAVAVRLIQLTA